MRRSFRPFARRIEGSVFTIVLIAIIVLGGFLWASQSFRSGSPGANLQFAQKRLALLEAENDRLRNILEGSEREKSAERQAALRNQIEREVEKIRGLKFLRPVDYETVTRKEVRDTVASKISQQYTDENFAEMAIALAAIGLLPERFPLKEKYLDLLGEQIAAFYDQHEHKLFMFEDASLDKMENRVVLAHELTHALQDQHFHLSKLPLDVKDDDDRAFAAAALVEGEATVVMTEYMLRNFSVSDLRGTIASIFTQNLEELAGSPLYLREMLLFPYLRGQEFAMVLQARGGYQQISDAYRQVPESTAQILHPEKYLAEPRELPVRIRFTDGGVFGQKPIFQNTLGEIGVQLLFTKWIDEETGSSIASGWRGDRYAVFNLGDASSVVWKSEWRNENEAQEFADGLRRYVAARYGRNAVNRAISVERTGKSVLFIDSENAKIREQLREFAGIKSPLAGGS